MEPASSRLFWASCPKRGAWLARDACERSDGWCACEIRQDAGFNRVEPASSRLFWASCPKREAWLARDAYERSDGWCACEIRQDAGFNRVEPASSRLFWASCPKRGAWLARDACERSHGWCAREIRQDAGFNRLEACSTRREEDCGCAMTLGAGVSAATVPGRMPGTTGWKPVPPQKHAAERERYETGVTGGSPM